MQELPTMWEQGRRTGYSALLSVEVLNFSRQMMHSASGGREEI